MTDMEFSDTVQVKKQIPAPSGLPVLPPFDPSINTKKYCTFALYLSGVVGFAALVAGIVLFKQQMSTASAMWVQVSPSVAIPLSLLFGLVVAICTDALSYIHYMSLQWALFHEGRLEFNSNLRLFTSAKSYPANRAPINFLSLVFLVISYAGASQSVWQREDRIYFGVVALIFLGIGLLGQVAISAYCLYGAVSRKILSWSASPLNTALACLHHGLYNRHPGRGMMGVESKDLPPEPQRPQKRQPSMRITCRTTYYIVYWLFFFAFLTIVLASTVCVLCVSLVRDPDAQFSFFNEAPEGSEEEIATADVDVGIQSKDNLLPQFLVFLFGLVMQIVITFTLHCAELVVNVFRDERSWRDAAKPRGTPLGNGAIESARTSFAWMFLFILKPVAQWLFGAQGITYNIQARGWIGFNPIPLFVLAVVAVVLAVFATCLAFRKQSGPQPAAYGHLQTIIDAVDDWGKGDSGRLWWGYKGLGGDGVGMVGTSGIREAVKPVKLQGVYH